MSLVYISIFHDVCILEWTFLQSTMNKQNYLTSLVMDCTRYKIHKFWPVECNLGLWNISWVFHKARLHIRVKILFKYHEDTRITCEVMARTSYKMQNFDLWPSNHDLDLWHRVMGFVYIPIYHNELLTYYCIRYTILTFDL